MILSILYIIVLLIAGISILAALIIGASALTIFIVWVPFVPTPQKNVKIIIDQLDLKPGKIFYDLGCGEGRFLIEAENRGAKAFGFEISPWPYMRCKINLLANKSQAKVFYQNFYKANLADADAIFCFLLDNVMPKVEAKLKKELKPGAKIACFGFPLPTWPTEKIVEIKKDNKRASKIYLYKK